MEIVRLQNANAISEFYLLKVFFHWGDIFEICSENIEIFQIFENDRDKLCLRVPSGNQVDGLPLAAIPNRSVFEKARPCEDP